MSPSSTPSAPLQSFAAHSRHLHLPRAALRAALRVTYPTRLAVVPSRTELPELLNRRGLLGCGAEIGVKQGHFSEEILRRWRGRHLVSIDPWSEAGAEDYEDVANVAQPVHERFYAETQRRLARFGARSTIWRTTGAQAAKRVLHHSLDFVYIDARHDYDSVMRDLADWHDKVRPGGLLAGHDYLDGDRPEGRFGVKSAVDEFCAERGLRPRGTFGDPPWPSWIVTVPRA